ncbi:hypothetical protein, partial [Streptomyces sp.]|uniref:hypothetical protein n=1 Tax=Streptomyces sp. TaxID=1931 RepID=UPI002F95F271
MSSDQQYAHGEQQQPYDPYGQQQYPQGYAQPEGPQQYGQEQYGQPDGQQQYGQQPYGGHQDPGATQTWEGQTWDTQYQPVVSPPAAADTAYLPPQAGHDAAPQAGYQDVPQAAAGPLPPETPVAPVAYEPPVVAPEPEAGPAYSAPTTSGNTRITDAQRARAEGRSPIIDPGMQPAALTAGLGLLLAGGAAVGPYGLLVPLVLLQAVTAAGWFRLNGMWPARQGIALAFAGGLAADVALLAAGRDNAPAAILGALGVWVLLALVLQLRSHADPDERMYGLMATVASAALTILAAGHLGADPDAVAVGGIAVAAATVARALPLPGPASVVVALLAAA